MQKVSKGGYVLEEKGNPLTNGSRSFDRNVANKGNTRLLVCLGNKQIPFPRQSAELCCLVARE